MKLLARKKRNFGVKPLVFGIGMLAVFGLLAFPWAGKSLAAQLELDGQMGGLGSTVTFTLAVNNAPNDVASLGVDIGYCETVLEFESADFTGGLLESFSFKDVSNPSPGVLRLGAFTAGAPMPAGASDTLVTLGFTVIGDQDCILPLSDLKDDIMGWSTKDGIFTYIEFAIDPAAVTMCEGASVEFTIVPEGIGTPPFTWLVDDVEVQSSDSRTFVYMGPEAGVHIIKVEDLVGLTAQATATVEAEDDTGALDIPAASGKGGANVTIPVRMQNAPNPVNSLGFDVRYDPAILTYVSADFAGTLLADWPFKDASNPSAGLVRVGGFTADEPIGAGTSGDVVYLTFIVTCEDCTSTKLALEELKDHLDGWNASEGCFLACCLCSGDVNGDGEITPLDALCAFEKYLEICPTSCEMACEDVCCDVNGDGECTPLDALCIFLKYLELPSCLDG